MSNSTLNIVFSTIYMAFDVKVGTFLMILFFYTFVYKHCHPNLLLVHPLLVWWILQASISVKKSCHG
jgi:hypothetical protein